MPDPNPIVSNVIRFHTPQDRPPGEMLRERREVGVELEGGRRVRLDPGNERSAGFAHVLEGLRKLRNPVYLEVDAQDAVTRLLIPHVARVIGFVRASEGLQVRLEASHAVHLLRENNPAFATLEVRLREAQQSRTPLIVTVNDAGEIIDLRGYTPDPEGPPIPGLEPEVPRQPGILGTIRELFRRLWRWPWWPWWWFGCISPVYAQQVFDAMAATTCDPLTVPAPCIPFMYPDDGCWARAHEMCRLMINMGLSPRKVWIECGGVQLLRADTRNRTTCYVQWWWHVAPTLCVRHWFFRRTMVIDPSLFTTPVTLAQWQAKQTDPASTLTETSADQYGFGGGTDPAYVDTAAKLAYYRLQLFNRANGPDGPPPYAHCPA